MSEDPVARQLERLRSLMSPERAGEVASAPPQHEASEVGAEAAVGFQTDDGRIRATVYVFEDWSGHHEVVQRLQQLDPPAEGEEVKHATNGGMLFVGRTDVSGPDGTRAKLRLAKLVSAFAGDE